MKLTMRCALLSIMLGLLFCCGLMPSLAFAEDAQVAAMDSGSTASDQVSELTKNLTARFATGGDYGSITNGTDYAAYGLYLLGQSADINVDTLQTNFEAAELTDAGTMARYILALSAADVDCTQYGQETDAAGNVTKEGRDLVAEMKALATSGLEKESLYSLVWILPALNEYASTDDGTIAKVTSALLAAQTADGLFDGGYGADTQTSAQALTALSPFCSTDDKVKTACDEGVKALLTRQNTDGGFCYYPVYGTYSDVDTTGAVVVALVSLGKDPAVDAKTEQNSTPITYLVSAADSDMNWYSGSYNEAMTSSTVLFALAADQAAAGTALNPLKFEISATEQDKKIRAFAVRLYTEVLDRAPDAEGLADQVSALKDGAAPAEIAYNYFASKEYTAKNETASQTVERVYQVMFGRASDASGKAMWVGYLEDGMSVRAVIAGFSQSQEYKEYFSALGVDNQTIGVTEARDQNQGVTAFCGRLYTECLGRSFDAEGINTQAGAILDGTSASQIAVNFFTGVEFANLKLSNSDIIERCYETMMGRASDADGKAYWESEMTSGMSVESLVNGFAQSDEWADICASYGVAK